MKLSDIQVTVLVVLMVIFCICFGLACAPPPQQYWIKPDSNFTVAEFNKDRYRCLQESQQSASSRSGNQATSGVVTNDGLFSACMYAKGWELSATPQEPENIKPQDTERKPEPGADSPEKTKKIKPQRIERKQESRVDSSERSEEIKPITSTNNTPNIASPPVDQLTTTSNASPQYLVVVKATNLRVEANDKSKIIIAVKKGERVEKLGISGKWINVKLSSDKSGWIFSGYVK